MADDMRRITNKVFDWWSNTQIMVQDTYKSTTAYSYITSYYKQYIWMLALGNLTLIAVHSI